MAFKVQREGNYYQHDFTVTNQDIHQAVEILSAYEDHFKQMDCEYYQTAIFPENFNRRGSEVVEAICAIMDKHIKDSNGQFDSTHYNMHHETSGEHFNVEVPYIITAHMEMLASIQTALQTPDTSSFINSLEPPASSPYLKP